MVIELRQILFRLIWGTVKYPSERNLSIFLTKRMTEQSARIRGTSPLDVIKPVSTRFMLNCFATLRHRHAIKPRKLQPRMHLLNVCCSRQSCKSNHTNECLDNGISLILSISASTTLPNQQAADDLPRYTKRTVFLQLRNSGNGARSIRKSNL